MRPPDNRSRWEEKLHRSGFFLGALFLHAAAFVMLATWVVSRPPPPVQNNPIAHYVPVSTEKREPPPRAVTSASTPSVDQVTVATDVPVSVQTITGASDFGLPVGPLDTTEIVKAPPLAHGKLPTANVLSHAREDNIRKSLLIYRSAEEIRQHDPAARFPVYVAKYAQGDWACNTRLDKDGNIVAGSIPDLVAKINEWSHGAIRGDVVPRPLDIGSRELLDRMPPFIFFTGHKDFVLTDAEVANLRDYLESGGAIWGDNALAGKGSRFDIAFHREMLRVVPGEKFNYVPMDGDIFTKGKFAISTVPAGINFHAEPLEHLDIDGVPAILYTPNDYSDLFAMRILPGDTKIQLGRPDPASPLTTSYLLQVHRAVFFRNFTLQSSLESHRLGMNIVTYLLTRWDDKVGF